MRDLTDLANELSFWPHHRNPVSEDGQQPIKCIAYRMGKGLCLRTNNILTYCEANRLVSDSIFFLYHLYHLL